jgi:hypothetical protein
MLIHDARTHEHEILIYCYDLDAMMQLNIVLQNTW